MTRSREAINDLQSLDPANMGIFPLVAALRINASQKLLLGVGAGLSGQLGTKTLVDKHPIAAPWIEPIVDLRRMQYAMGAQLQSE